MIVVEGFNDGSTRVGHDVRTVQVLRQEVARARRISNDHYRVTVIGSVPIKM